MGSYTSSVLLELVTMLVHQLDQHYTSVNQLEPAWNSCWFMLDFPIVTQEMVDKPQILLML